jgi:hypothetical protein
MTQRDLAALACRFVAIWTIVTMIIESISIFVLLASRSDQGTPDEIGPAGNIAVWAISLTPLLAGIAVGAVLWSWADYIALLMTRRSYNADGQLSLATISPADLQVVLFSCIGLWIAVSSVQQVCNSLIVIVQEGRLIGSSLPAGDPQRQSLMLKISLLQCLVQVSIGLWLMVGSSGLVRILRDLRDVGRDDVSREREMGTTPAHSDSVHSDVE